MCNTWIYNLPKVELHCHLDGSMAADTVRSLAEKVNLNIPEDDTELRKMLQAPENCHNLVEYLETFRLPLALLQSEYALSYATYTLMRDAAKENIMYMEIRFAPRSCMEKGISMRQAIQGVLHGMRQGEEQFGIHSRLILCAMRHTDVDINLEILKVGEEFLNQGVCGVDLAGNEADFTPMQHKKFFEMARSMGYEITIHAGECLNPQNVVDAIALGAKRIGHGIAIMNNSQAESAVKKAGVCLEMCPSSNLQTKAIYDLKNYPVKHFLEQNIVVTLNTDNRTVTGTTLSREYELMKEMQGLSKQDMITLVENGIRAAFLPVSEKERLLEKLIAYHI